MNTTHTRKKLIAGAVSAVVVAAAGTAALPGAPSSAPAPRYPTGVAISSAMPALAAVVTPNSLYAAAGGPAVAVLGPNGSLALPDGYYIAPVAPVGPVPVGSSGLSATAPAADRATAATLSTLYRPASSSGRGDEATSPVAVGGPTNFGLFSPTGAFLGLVGPGGLLIGDGVLPGQDGGILFGNGADGGSTKGRRRRHPVRQRRKRRDRRTARG